MKSKHTILLAFLIITSSFQVLFGQAKNQHTLLLEIGDGSVFQQYYGITKEGDTYSGQANIMCVMKFENNIYNKFSVFKLNKEGKDEVLINSGFGFLSPNHYTEPSLIYSKKHKLAYLYLDGYLYALKNISDANNVQSFTIDNIYVLMKPASGTHNSGKAAAKELKKRNHEAVIKSYLREMKGIQEKETANFTPEIQAEIDGIENKNSADKKAIKDANDAYWLSPEGQRVLAADKNKNGGDKNDGYITILNSGKEALYVMTEGGTSSSISAGSTSKWPCTANIYYCYKDSHNSYNVKGDLIANGKQNCGKTITVSAGK